MTTTTPPPCPVCGHGPWEQEHLSHGWCFCGACGAAHRSNEIGRVDVMDTNHSGWCPIPRVLMAGPDDLVRYGMTLGESPTRVVLR